MISHSIDSLWGENRPGHWYVDIFCSTGREQFSKSVENLWKTVSFEALKNVQGQISKHSFKVKSGALCLLSFKLLFKMCTVLKTGIVAQMFPSLTGDVQSRYELRRITVVSPDVLFSRSHFARTESPHLYI